MRIPLSTQERQEFIEFIAILFAIAQDLNSNFFKFKFLSVASFFGAFLYVWFPEAGCGSFSSLYV